jgi:superfamily II DNA or RNA helicase
MADVLNGLLAEHAGQSLDVATAYFNVGGWQLVRQNLAGVGGFRLLLGDEPEAGTDLGLRPVGAKPVKGLIRDLAGAEFNPQTLLLVEDLIAFLRRPEVSVRLYTKGFLHAKSYIFYGGGDFDRLQPVAAIVGSSNFTRPGLTTNKELNLSHRANMVAEDIEADKLSGKLEKAERDLLKTIEPEAKLAAANLPGVLAINELASWFERQWNDARDFKQELIDLLDASKFGRKEYTPYQVYLKAIFEYFRDDLERDEAAGAASTRSTVDLSEFQEDAVKKARKILARYDGVIVADSVGLGKTWIGKKLLEDYAYHLRYKALVICPAALRKMWENELQSATIAARVITQESLGGQNFEAVASDYAEADLVLVDESHNFRNRTAQRYENIERVLAANNRRGGLSGERKKVILLTATPINNTVFDLYNQVSLITGGDRTYFAAAGIGDLQRYFLAARRNLRQQDSGIALFNLLEEIVIRRTRPFIKQAYPNATIKGKPMHWPERRLKTVRYNLETTYSGIYQRVVSRIENLRLVPYRLENYKKQGVERDVFEEGREEALVGIFKSRYLKRFESSVDAFRISVRRALEFLETFESYLLEGKVLNSGDFQKALRFLAREDEEDDGTPPASRSEELDANAEARQFIDGLQPLEAAKYDLKRLHNDVRRDVQALQDIWRDIVNINAKQDAKLNRLKELLAGDLRGKKVLLFTYYKDTARYLYRELGSDDASGAVAWRESAGQPKVRRMDSGADSRERANLVAQFAPVANNKPEWAGTDKEVDIMISTDVLSEGQNLQDCGILINYDLHWNPTRMIQRAGRIDRIGTTFDTLWIHNMFPDDGLEELLGLVESLSQKIAGIDNAGLLDASILGEVVHPQNFNTLRRIADEDGKVVEEQEQFVELVSSEFMLQTLRGLLDDQKRQMLEELPDGIHSGLVKNGAQGVFFYFVADVANSRNSKGKGKKSAKSREHFWRYVDLVADPKGGQILDNRYIITNLIACQPDTPRVVPPVGEIDIFDLQEKVIASIVQSAVEQVAIEEAPKILDPIQQTIITTIRGYINNPAFSRKELVGYMQKLSEPQPSTYIKTLRRAYDTFGADGNIESLIAAVKDIASSDANVVQPIILSTTADNSSGKPGEKLVKAEDLRLICFSYLSSS